MQYKTRYKTKLDGKKNIYICAHPDDYVMYEDEVEQALYKIMHNCAIWHEELIPDAMDRTEHEAILGRMHLIIVLATNRFLNENSIGLEIDMPYFIGRNTPIVPIIMEKNVEYDFNTKYHNLHMLSKYDLEHLEYSENNFLRNYLNQWSDESKQHEKVYSYFEGSIFLSYRKKDIEKVIETAKVLHNISKTRFVETWYDDFLIPGENFDNIISDHIKKCDAFVIVVTDNVFEPNNYVLTHELPQALKLKKPIIAVKTGNINEAAFEKHIKIYNNIIVCENYELLPKAIDAIKAFDKHSKTPSADTFYYMGYAFFHGIGVEIDAKRAYEYLTISGEKGNSEAALLLYVIYKWDIENQNRERIIYWLKKYVEESSNKTSLERISNLSNLAAEYYDVGDYDEALAIYKRIATMTKAISPILGIKGKLDKYKFIDKQITAYNYIADVYIKKNMHYDALDALIKSLDVYEKRVKDSEKIETDLLNEILLDIGWTGILLGQVYLSIKKYEEGQDAIISCYNEMKKFSDVEDPRYLAKKGLLTGIFGYIMCLAGEASWDEIDTFLTDGIRYSYMSWKLSNLPRTMMEYIQLHVFRGIALAEYDKPDESIQQLEEIQDLTTMVFSIGIYDHIVAWITGWSILALMYYDKKDFNKSEYYFKKIFEYEEALPKIESMELFHYYVSCGYLLDLSRKKGNSESENRYYNRLMLLEEKYKKELKEGVNKEGYDIIHEICFSE